MDMKSKTDYEEEARKRLEAGSELFQLMVERARETERGISEEEECRLAYQCAVRAFEPKGLNAINFATKIIDISKSNLNRKNNTEGYKFVIEEAKKCMREAVTKVRTAEILEVYEKVNIKKIQDIVDGTSDSRMGWDDTVELASRYAFGFDFNCGADGAEGTADSSNISSVIKPSAAGGDDLWASDWDHM